LLDVQRCCGLHGREWGVHRIRQRRPLVVVVELARGAPASMAEDVTARHAAAARFLLVASGYGDRRGRVKVVFVACYRRLVK
jgi:hypothetical protein